MAEVVGFVPKNTIFWGRFTHAFALFKHNPSLFLTILPPSFTDIFTDSDVNNWIERMALETINALRNSALEFGGKTMD